MWENVLLYCGGAGAASHHDYVRDRFIRASEILALILEINGVILIILGIIYTDVIMKNQHESAYERIKCFWPQEVVYINHNISLRRHEKQTILVYVPKFRLNNSIFYSSQMCQFWGFSYRRASSPKRSTAVSVKMNGGKYRGDRICVIYLHDAWTESAIVNRAAAALKY